jgi:hypothetical protein
MLHCLDRPHRLAYVLGEIPDLSGPEAAQVRRETSPDANSLMSSVSVTTFKR